MIVDFSTTDLKIVALNAPLIYEGTTNTKSNNSAAVLRKMVQEFGEYIFDICPALQDASSISTDPKDQSEVKNFNAITQTYK